MVKHAVDEKLFYNSEIYDKKLCCHDQMCMLCCYGEMLKCSVAM